MNTDKIQSKDVTMTLYSAWYCPFAQRAWMALEYKGCSFQYIETDPYNKTDKWLQLSRDTGQVPVLISRHASSGQLTVTDSNRIVEFLNDLHTTTPYLYSPDSFECAEQKYWVDHINKNVIPYFYRFLKAHNADELQQEAKTKLLDGLSTLGQAMSKKGPYFIGKQLSAVDIALIPFSYRMELLLRHFRNFSLPQDTDVWRRYYSWYDSVLGHESFQKTMGHDSNYDESLIEFYIPYSQGGGQTDVTNI